ncbi:hypothetical protein HT746_00360 [Burkholderia pyrrocinia]|uniref:hypothetical protein n=1 Tax=Burkholderia pyrrocinia TaxID=60550 RepID=UPI001575C36B|nr:hypothetical protein [Burkholderia pyrrocinia]NTX25620.1 hypothetical protein [Burkholderia pyrrocinia]
MSMLVDNIAVMIEHLYEILTIGNDALKQIAGRAKHGVFACEIIALRRTVMRSCSELRSAAAQ